MIEFKLTRTDRSIINYLLTCNYQKEKISGFNIAHSLGLSYSNVLFRLRHMRKEGYIRKTINDTYVIQEEFQKEFDEDLKERLLLKEKEIQKAIKFIKDDPSKAPVWARRATDISGIKTTPQEIIDKMRNKDDIEKESDKIDEMLE